MRRACIKHWIAAALFSALSGCAVAPQSMPPLSEQLPEASPPLPSPSRPAGSIAKRILERLHEPFFLPEASQSAVQAEPGGVDEKYQLTGEAARELERGRASWYGASFHGRLTANGERYDKYALTAAHKTLPFGTVVRVRSLTLGREVDVRINDRGPFAPGRVIDVSQAAAEALGLTAAGVAEVSLNLAESTLQAMQAPGSVRKTRSPRTKAKAKAKTRLMRHSPAVKQP